MSDKLKANIAERLSLITELRKEGSALKRKEERCAQENYALKQQVAQLQTTLEQRTNQLLEAEQINHGLAKTVHQLQTTISQLEQERNRWMKDYYRVTGGPRHGIHSDEPS